MNIPDVIQRELDRAPGHYKIEKGKKHIHIRVNGYLVGILPIGKINERSPRGHLNIRSQIRRAINAMMEGE